MNHLIGSDAAPAVAAPRPTAAATLAADFDDVYRAAYRVAYRMLGNREDAAEIAEEALARASVRAAKLGPHPGAWTMQQAADLAYDRSRRRGSAIAAAARAAGPAPTGALAQRVELHRVLAAMPRRQRRVALLRHVADVPEPVVSDLLDEHADVVAQLAARSAVTLRRLGAS